LPLGTNSPADVIGVTFSPTVRPGSLSNDQSAARRTRCSLNERRCAIASSIAASTSADTCADPSSSALTRSWCGSSSMRSKRASARHTAASPCSRTSSIRSPIDRRSAGSKISSRPRCRSAARSSTDMSAHRIRRITPEVALMPATVAANAGRSACR
jgi:hypothetical protein